jgi:hypothetical protein
MNASHLRPVVSPRTVAQGPSPPQVCFDVEFCFSWEYGQVLYA